MSGGDPVGQWRADSATIHLVDSSLLALMPSLGVFAFTHEEQLRGTLTIRQDKSYSAACTLGVTASVWLTSQPTSPLVYVGGDTLVGSGVVARPLPNVLIFRMRKFAETHPEQFFFGISYDLGELLIYTDEIALRIDLCNTDCCLLEGRPENRFSFHQG